MKKYILLFLSVITTVFGKHCFTPNLEIGKCIKIHKCPALTRNLHEGMIEHELFLKESICFERKSKYLLVCCGTYSNYKSNISFPTKGIRRTTTTTTTTTAAPVTEEAKIWKDPRLHPNFNLLPTICGDVETTSDRIFGGKKTEISEFPWIALLEYTKNGSSTEHSCAGSLINDRYVLTAAHCIIGEIEQDNGKLFRIRLGEHDTRFNQDCIKKLRNRDDYYLCYEEPQNISVEKIIVHPKYSVLNKNKHYDIALVRLKYPAKISETVQPICLPLKGESSKDRDRLTVVGWGYTEQAIPSPVKLKAVVPYIADKQCKEVWRKISFDFTYNIIDSQFCAGGERGIDSCQKDSGGPIMTTIPGNKIWYQEGIVSFGIFCGERMPAIYTRVSSFLDWILDNMKP